MKKASLLTIILSSVISAACFAQNYSVVNVNDNPADAIYALERNAPVSFDKGKTVELNIDFSEAEIVDFDNDHRTVIRDFGTFDQYSAERGQSFLDEWPTVMKMMTAFACKRLKTSFGADFAAPGECANPDYKLIVKLGQFEFGHFVAVGGVKDGGTVTKGLIEIYDSTGALAAVYDINYLRGANVGYGNKDRLREWGKFFSKEFKKAF